MRNAVSNCLELLVGYLNEDIDVNTITIFQTDDDIDFNKKNIYNLVNIGIVSSNFETKTIGFEVLFITQRDDVKTTITNKLEGNDNRVDNIQCAHSVLNNLVKKLRLLNNDFDIQFISATEPQIFFKAYTNGMDGMTIEIVLQYPDNDTNVCCDGC
jgi:hypothetical protein